MDLMRLIVDLARKRGRASGKADAIADNLNEAVDAESRASQAKNAKDFDKFKKESLSSVDAAEKAVKPCQTELAIWEDGIDSLEKSSALEKDKIVQQQKDAEAVSQGIDEVNAQITAYNRTAPKMNQRPLFAKKSAIAVKLASAAAALTAASALAKDERTALEHGKRWVSDAMDKLKELKGRVAKSKFQGTK